LFVAGAALITGGAWGLALLAHWRHLHRA
jgi:hypothetical protein